MTVVDSSILTPEERAVYGPRANILIPAAEGMPSATEVSVDTVWIDEALAARPDLVNAFRESLATDKAQEAAVAVENLHRDAPELFDAFGVLTAGAYLMNPQVKALIGYPGQEAREIVGDDVPEYVDMLEKVVDRGGVYRPTLHD